MYHSDPSVKYFGLEWPTVYRRCNTIKLHLTEFWELLERSKQESNKKLSLLLSDMDILAEEVAGHLESVTNEAAA